MKKPEPRGFKYPLEPLHTKCSWDLLALQQELSLAFQALDLCQRQIQNLEADRSAAINRLVLQQTGKSGFFADSQRLLHAYITRQTRRLAEARTEQEQLETQGKQIVGEIHRLQKLSDELELDHTEAIREHLREKSKVDGREADDAWLRSLPRRTGT